MCPVGHVNAEMQRIHWGYAVVEILTDTLLEDMFLPSQEALTVSVLSDTGVF